MLAAQRIKWGCAGYSNSPDTKRVSQSSETPDQIIILPVYTVARKVNKEEHGLMHQTLKSLFRVGMWD